jgi:hypothetical protein
VDEFDNNWDAVASTPDNRFTTPHVRDVLMQVASWELPEEYALIVRVQNPKNYKIQEKVFKRIGAANQYCIKKEAEGFLVTAYNNEQLYCSAGFLDTEYE